MAIKQTLEKIITPLKWLDKIILTQYTKMGKKWEDKGRSRYDLCSFLDISSCAVFANLAVKTHINIPFGELTPFYGALMGLDLPFNSDVFSDTQVNGESLSEHSFIHYGKSLIRLARLPTLIPGILLIGKGAFDIYNHVCNKDHFALSQGINSISLGYSFAALASSMYLKDTDPKLLEKDKVVARASIKERVEDLIPNLLPQPVPVLQRASYEVK